MHSSGSHLSKDMLDLIKSIGDSRSKQEEDKIIVKEVEVLKKKIKESGIVPKKMKEYLIRAIYIEMLGHEAPFAHLYSVNLTQDKNILNKRVGYLACCLLLSDQSEFLIMLVASLQKDIQSLNWVEVCMALTCVVKFANSTIMQAVTEPVMKLLDNKNEQVRKKAVMCLYRFYQVSPQSVPDCDSRMRRLLCDFDPSVMAATLPYFKEMCMKNPENYKDLVSPLIVILKQVIEHKLPREYDYHRFPGPWIQVILLEILSILGRYDKSASENMYEILQQCLRRADDTGINIGYAIVYQCLKTICTIYPNPHLIELASNTISRFLSSDSPNLRCTGINGLAMIIQINPNYVLNHQQIIVDCLEENDETLKKNTFELLYKMTSLKNVEVIVEKMMNYLKHTTLESVSKKDILTKITELTERFAPSKTWFIRIMNELFVNFGERQKEIEFAPNNFNWLYANAIFSILFGTHSYIFSIFGQFMLKTKKRSTDVIIISHSIEIVLFIIFSFIGYFYSTHSQNLLSSIIQKERSIPILIVQIIFVLLIQFLIPIQMTQIKEGIRNTLANAALANQPLSLPTEIIITVIVLLLGNICVYLTQEIKLFIGISGGICSGIICFVLPYFAYCKVFEEANYKHYIGFIVMLVTILVSATTTVHSFTDLISGK